MPRSTNHATRYGALSRSMANTNLPPTNAYSAYSRSSVQTSSQSEEYNTKFGTLYSIPWRYKRSVTYKPDKALLRESAVTTLSSSLADSYLSAAEATKVSKVSSSTSYSNYVRKNILLSTIYTTY